ncbi:MAG: hypothetical protein ACK5V3_14205, partial [Bdellovibrionales bacterium]
SLSVQASGWLELGERALNLQRDSALVRVIGIEAQGTYVVQFEEGPLRGQRGGNWKAADLAKLYGCTSEGLCVGDRTYNLARETALAEVVAIQSNLSQVVLRYISGALSGQKGGNWGFNDLAVTRGCGNQYCVGDYALNRSRNYAQVQVIGVQPKQGTYVLRFLDGALAGQIGGNWKDSDLVSTIP